MDNPIRAMRINLGLSQGDLIRFSGLNRMVVLRTEQGLYSSPSRQITKPLIDLAGGNLIHEDIVGLYKSSQTFTRQSQSWWIKKIVDPLPVAEGIIHPFVLLRSHAPVPHMYQSRMGFCKAFCLHPNSMRLFETGEQISPPESLIVGLSTAGLSPVALAWITESALRWAQANEGGR